MSVTGTTTSSRVQFMMRFLPAGRSANADRTDATSRIGKLIGRPMICGASPARHRPAVPSAMMMPAMQTPALPDRPILVVDDDAKIVRLVRTYLERDGFA